MEGYLKLRLNPMFRRLLTRLLAIIPAVITISMFGEDEVDKLLIFSQVVLSMQLGFAIIPLIHFCSDKRKMGIYAINTPAKIASWIIAAILVYLNLKLFLNEAIDFFAASKCVLVKSLIVSAGGLLIFLLLYILVHPFLKKRSDPILPQ
jgi:manganese transport protein